MMDQQLKQCINKIDPERACGQWKPLSEFEFRKDTQKYRGQCKDCLKKFKKEYNNINSDKISEYQAQWRSDNADILKIKKKQYADDHKEEKREYDKIYREENKDIIKIKKNNAIKIKRQIYLSFRLKTNVSSAVKKSIKKQNGSKLNKSTFKYLPYTVEELKSHIEELFSHSDNLTKDGKVWMT